MNHLERGYSFGPPRGDTARVCKHQNFRFPKGGAQRPVENYHHINLHIHYEHFKIKGIHILRVVLRKGDLMVNIDLKDAYFLVVIRKSHHKYLRFL